MKKIAFLILCSFCCVCTAFAQFAVVIDDAGFVDIYDNEKEELDRLGSDGVVAITAEDDEWVQVDYTKYGEYAASSGFVKKGKLKDISSFTEIPLTKDSTNYAILSYEDIIIRLKTKPFDEAEHTITRFSEDNTDLITAINDAEYWGTRVGLPTSQYLFIIIEKGGEEIELPVESYSNLFNPFPSLTKAYYDKDNDVLYIYSSNGDVSGAYTALWVVEENEYAIHYIFD